MGNRTFSIALCTYNGAQYLREQLESFAAQVRLPDELVVCDDRSSDETVQIVKNFSAKVPFPVRLFVNECNLGSTKNFEKAIELCSGDLIALSDQDDVWHLEKLKLLEEVFEESPGVGAIFTDAHVVRDDLAPLGYSLWEAVGFTPRRQRRLVSGEAIEVLLRGKVVTGATMAFRSEFRNIVIPIPVNWVHDGWIALLIAATADLAIIPQPLIKYRQHRNNQIGAARKGFSQRLAAARHTRVSGGLQNAYDQYVEAYERMKKLPQQRLGAKTIHLIEAKLHHWSARANMPQSRLLRLRVILREAITLGYFFHSNGIYSMAQDLFF